MHLTVYNSPRSIIESLSRISTTFNQLVIQPFHSLASFGSAYQVCFGEEFIVSQAVIDQLVDDGILGRSKSGKILKPKGYQSIVAEIQSAKSVNWLEALKTCASQNKGIITRRTYMEYLPDWISTDKVRYSLTKLESMGVLKREGIGKGTKYHIVKLPENIEL